MAGELSVHIDPLSHLELLRLTREYLVGRSRPTISISAVPSLAPPASGMSTSAGCSLPRTLAHGHSSLGRTSAISSIPSTTGWRSWSSSRHRKGGRPRGITSMPLSRSTCSSQRRPGARPARSPAGACYGNRPDVPRDGPLQGAGPRCNAAGSRLQVARQRSGPAPAAQAANPDVRRYPRTKSSDDAPALVCDPGRAPER